MRKAISLLGCTGSIGRQTLNVVRHLENVRVVGLAARNNVDLVEQQVLEFKPEVVAMFEEKAAQELKRRLPRQHIVCGVEGLCEVASWHSADFVVLGMVGSKGILPAAKAIMAGKDIGLANKEILVAAGEYIFNLAKEKKVSLVPIDSEHSAILQCIHGEDRNQIKRIILTASGGPFLNHSLDALRGVTAQDAAAHPTWAMGSKVSIDCSTLMNKGFEVMEARWLFDFPPEMIDVVIHPQSLVHSMVEFVDGSIKAKISVPNMELPIQYAITYPERVKRNVEPFNFLKHGKFEFFAPNREKFRCLDLAYEALRQGGTLPCFVNAANEVLVERFCKAEVSWLGICEKLEHLMLRHTPIKALTVDAILEVDREARFMAGTI